MLQPDTGMPWLAIGLCLSQPWAVPSANHSCKQHNTEPEYPSAQQTTNRDTACDAAPAHITLPPYTKFLPTFLLHHSWQCRAVMNFFLTQALQKPLDLHLLRHLPTMLTHCQTYIYYTSVIKRLRHHTQTPIGLTNKPLGQNRHLAATH